MISGSESLMDLPSASVTEGTNGNQIEWHASDPNTKQSMFNVTKDGLIILSGPWTPNATVVVDLDGFAVGMYTFTLSINDGYGGITVESVVVTITVSSSPGGIPGPSIIGLISCILFGTCIIILRKFIRRIQTPHV